MYVFNRIVTSKILAPNVVVFQSTLGRKMKLRMIIMITCYFVTKTLKR